MLSSKKTCCIHECEYQVEEGKTVPGIVADMLKQGVYVEKEYWYKFYHRENCDGKKCQLKPGTTRFLLRDKTCKRDDVFLVLSPTQRRKQLAKTFPNPGKVENNIEDYGKVEEDGEEVSVPLHYWPTEDYQAYQEQKLKRKEKAPEKVPPLKKTATVRSGKKRDRSTSVIDDEAEDIDDVNEAGDAVNGRNGYETQQLDDRDAKQARLLELKLLKRMTPDERKDHLDFIVSDDEVGEDEEEEVESTVESVDEGPDYEALEKAEHELEMKLRKGTPKKRVSEKSVRSTQPTLASLELEKDRLELEKKRLELAVEKFQFEKERTKFQEIPKESTKKTVPTNKHVRPPIAGIKQPPKSTKKAVKRNEDETPPAACQSDVETDDESTPDTTTPPPSPKKSAANRNVFQTSPKSPTVLHTGVKVLFDAPKEVVNRLPTSTTVKCSPVRHLGMKSLAVSQMGAVPNGSCSEEETTDGEDGEEEAGVDVMDMHMDVETHKGFVNATKAVAKFMQSPNPIEVTTGNFVTNFVSLMKARAPDYNLAMASLRNAKMSTHDIYKPIATEDICKAMVSDDHQYHALVVTCLALINQLEREHLLNAGSVVVNPNQVRMQENVANVPVVSTPVPPSTVEKQKDSEKGWILPQAPSEFKRDPPATTPQPPKLQPIVKL
jgi:hypothetical protein